ncbi:MAG: hypothetical protein LBJ01_01705, partial [Tannerella sp.]|nr:hypothetical protein [Tannerella sp.]
GKWQLIKEITLNETQVAIIDSVDYSCENIIYHFREDQTLTVSNTEESMAYEYAPFPFCATCLPLNPRPNLLMGDSGVYCGVYRKYMVIFPELNPERSVDPEYPERYGILPLSEIRQLFLRIE